MSQRRPDLTTPEWKRLRLVVLDRDGWRCTSCAKPVEGSDATVDHIVPYTGPESNALHNLTTLCRSCNSSKQDRTLFRIDWARPHYLPNGIPA